MRLPNGQYEKLQRAVTAGVVALLAAVPALVQAAQPAAASVAPTMADYLGVYDALQNYRFGVEKHDQKALKMAFWPDGRHTTIPTPGGPEINLPLDGTRPSQGPDGKPAPKVGPRPGSDAGPDGPGGGRGAAANAAGGAGGTEVWHLPLDSYIHFDSPTRATHYEYFLSIYPQPEKKAPEGGSISNMEARISIAGWPGHYEDILEKRHGEWRILQRKSMINK